MTDDKWKFELEHRLLLEFISKWATGTHTNYDMCGKPSVDKIIDYIEKNFIYKGDEETKNS